MSLSTDARTRLGIATTDFSVGNEIADAINHSVGGRATVLAGQSSIVVTNAAIVSDSSVVATLAGTDGTALYVTKAVCAAGTVTISVNVAATADVAVAWLKVS